MSHGLHELLDSSDDATCVVSKDDIEMFIRYLIYKTRKAVERGKPRITVEFSVKQGNSLRDVWGYIAEVEVGGYRDN